MSPPKKPAFEWSFSVGNVISLIVMIAAVAASYFGMQERISILDEKLRSSNSMMTMGLHEASADRNRLEARVAAVERSREDATKERQTSLNRLIRLETLIEQQIQQGVLTLKAIERLDNKFETLDDRFNGLAQPPNRP